MLRGGGAISWRRGIGRIWLLPSRTGGEGGAGRSSSLNSCWRAEEWSCWRRLLGKRWVGSVGQLDGEQPLLSWNPRRIHSWRFLHRGCTQDQPCPPATGLWWRWTTDFSILAGNTFPDTLLPTWCVSAAHPRSSPLDPVPLWASPSLEALGWYGRQGLLISQDSSL